MYIYIYEKVMYAHELLPSILIGSYAYRHYI